MGLVYTGVLTFGTGVSDIAQEEKVLEDIIASNLYCCFALEKKKSNFQIHKVIGKRKNVMLA